MISVPIESPHTDPPKSPDPVPIIRGHKTNDMILDLDIASELFAFCEEFQNADLNDCVDFICDRFDLDCTDDLIDAVADLFFAD